MLRKLRIKFICINMTIVTVMLGVIFSVLYFSTSSNLERESIQMMESIAADPVKIGRPNEAPSDVRLPYFSIQVDPHGELINVSGGYFDLSDKDFLLEILEASRFTHEQIGVLPDYNLRFCRTITPLGQWIVFADMTSEQSTLRNLMKTCSLIGAAAFLVFLAISTLLARWAVKPVETAWRQQRQFVADVSHELKTPLTVIMTNAELLQTPDYEETEHRQFSGSILTMAKQMRGLVENLLELARVDNGTVKAEFGSVSLSELVSDAILPFEPLFFEQDMSLTAEIEPNITLCGSAAHLKQVMDILLDNARKYSSPRGRTSAELKRSGRRHCLLTVSNTGAPLSKEDLKNIFKRFYRADRARSMNGSYGLGLSIAQSIVEEHHGRIWAESRDGFNRFFVEFPLSSQLSK